MGHFDSYSVCVRYYSNIDSSIYSVHYPFNSYDEAKKFFNKSKDESNVEGITLHGIAYFVHPQKVELLTEYIPLDAE